MLINRPDPRKSINNIYEITSTEQAIKYLHACYSLPKKSSCLKSIRLGNYTTWPGLTIKNRNKYLPEEEETQK